MTLLASQNNSDISIALAMMTKTSSTSEKQGFSDRVFLDDLGLKKPKQLLVFENRIKEKSIPQLCSR
jgi:hypothetical protein